MGRVKNVNVIDAIKSLFGGNDIEDVELEDVTSEKELTKVLKDSQRKVDEGAKRFHHKSKIKKNDFDEALKVGVHHYEFTEEEKQRDEEAQKFFGNEKENDESIGR